VYIIQDTVWFLYIQLRTMIQEATLLIFY